MFNDYCLKFLPGGQRPTHPLGVKVRRLLQSLSLPNTRKKKFHQVEADPNSYVSRPSVAAQGFIENNHFLNVSQADFSMMGTEAENLKELLSISSRYCPGWTGR